MTTDADGVVAGFAVSAVSSPYWEALAEGKLVLPRCQACQEFFFYPRKWCPQCWSDQVEYVESAGTGAIWALTESHLAFQGVSKEDLPLTTVLVELDEGVRIPGRLAKADTPAAIGQRVRLAFADDPSTTLPEFRTV